MSNSIYNNSHFIYNNRNNRNSRYILGAKRSNEIYLIYLRTTDQHSRRKEVVAINLQDLCKQILEVDRSIRFVCIPNKFGKKIVAEYRKDLIQLLTEYESELYAIESVLRMNTRKDMGSKLGKPIYSFTLYEKVRRTTISLDNEDYPVLMVSFDIDADHESVILNKILPIVKKQFS